MPANDFRRRVYDGLAQMLWFSGDGTNLYIKRLERILNDLTYVAKDQAETSVLFELISARYERRSVLVTANRPFGDWGKVFPDPAMTVAAVDRLVHHSVIVELNVDSDRRRTAKANKAKGPERPATRATKKNTGDAAELRITGLIDARVPSSLSRYSLVVKRVTG